VAPPSRRPPKLNGRRKSFIRSWGSVRKNFTTGKPTAATAAVNVVRACVCMCMAVVSLGSWDTREFPPNQSKSFVLTVLSVVFSPIFFPFLLSRAWNSKVDSRHKAVRNHSSVYIV